MDKECSQNHSVFFCKVWWTGWELLKPLQGPSQTHVPFYSLFWSITDVSEHLASADPAHLGLFLCLPPAGVLPHSWTPLDKARWDRGHACFEIRIVPAIPWDMQSLGYVGWVGKVPWMRSDLGNDTCWKKGLKFFWEYPPELWAQCRDCRRYK